MRINLFKSRRVLGATLLLALLMLSLTAASAQDDGWYYYANGERIPLTVSTEFVTARFASGGSIGIDTAERNFSQIEETSSAFQPGLIAGQDFYVLPVDGINNQAGVLSLVDSMRSSSLAADYVNPVFEMEQFDLYLTTEFIAGFPDGTPRSEVDAYNAENGVAFVRELQPDVYLLSVTPAAGTDALTMANRYEEGTVATYGEPNWLVGQPLTIDPQNQIEVTEILPEGMPSDTLSGAPQGEESAGRLTYAPNDAFRNNAWHLRNYDQWQTTYPALTITPDADADVYELTPDLGAWDVTLGSNTTIIAVLDNGVQTSHPDLSTKMVSGYDAIASPPDNDPSPYDNATTRAFDAHGTHVAGLAAAITNNTIGVAGVCANCKIMPIRIFYTTINAGTGQPELFGTPAATLSAVNYASTNGAHVMVNSWSIGASTSITNALRSAATTGRGGLGMLIVIAAGNNSNPAVPNTPPVSFPARLSSTISGIIAVSASTWCDSVKLFNPSGGAIDCSGENWESYQGSEVGIAAPAHWLPSTDLTGADGYVSSDYSYFNGTSGAAPIVGGVAGLLISQNPTFTSEQIRDRILTTADNIHTAGYDTASGWGRLNAYKALTNTTTNTGTPNDHRAGSVVISSLPYNTSQTVLGTFRDRTDPVLACQGSNASVSNTVWFSFIAPYNMTVNANTIGSNFDTVLGVYNSSLTSVACNDDVNANSAQSLVSFDATAGAVYYIMIGDFTTFSDPNGILGTGSLSFNMSTSTQPPAGFTLNGHVTLQGRPAVPNPLWQVPLHVIVKPTIGGTAAFDGTRTTDLSGNFTVTNIQPGTYNVWVKHDHTLANMVQVTVVAADVPVEIGILREGDADNTNSVTLPDFSILATTFGKASADVGYDARADFNGDGVITINDFSLLANNFGQVGTAAP